VVIHPTLAECIDERTIRLTDPTRESAVGVVSYRKVLVPGAMKPQIQALLAADGITVDWLMDRPVPPAPDSDTQTTPLDA
jgi:hypothetical protein